MRFLLLSLTLVALIAGQAFASDGNVSSNTLAKMGLSNMQVMNDNAGMAVRGMGYQPPSNCCGSWSLSSYASYGCNVAGFCGYGTGSSLQFATATYNLSCKSTSLSFCLVLK